MTTENEVQNWTCYVQRMHGIEGGQTWRPNANPTELARRIAVCWRTRVGGANEKDKRMLAFAISQGMKV